MDRLAGVFGTLSQITLSLVLVVALMEYFGDESGHFKGVLNQDCEVCVLAVVAGVRIDCQRCAKKTVRRIDDIPEAKWNDLLDHQKRRFFECLSEQDELQFGYAVFDREKLHSMDEYHLLYQDIDLPPAWDLALAGYTYGEILYEMGAPDEQRAILEFDRISSKKQCEAVVEHVEHFVPSANIFFDGSRQNHGIQTADCLAGGIAEDIKKGTDWKDYLDSDSLYECSSTSLIQLERDLVNYSQ